MSIFKLFTTLFKAAPQIDPASFGDPLATEIDWTPLKGGGNSFRTHKAMQIDATRIIFQRTAGSYILPFTFMILGIVSVAAYFIFYDELIFFSSERNETLIVILTGTVFFLAGFFINRSFRKRIVFDKGMGVYIKGAPADGSIPPMENGKNMCQLSDIHAIQILSEFVSSNKSSYRSLELNLVKHDGQRLNVIDHSARKHIKEDARLLGQFLGVPVWDVTR